MPTLPQQQTIVQYTANVSQPNYTFAFYAPMPTDIQVFYQAPNAQPIPSSDLLTLGVDYTVAYNADPTTGGTITLLFTPTTGYYLTINRNVEVSLITNFGNAQTFNGNTLDSALDRLLLLIQQNYNYIQNRNLSYVINTYLPNAQPFTQLPPLATNQIWQGSGAGVIAATLSNNPDWSTLQSMLANNAPGTDGSRLVGYYDATTSTPTTVEAFLANLIPFLQNYLFQPGDMKCFAGSSVQSGWLACDGSAISRTVYANLFAAIGTTWGAGDGINTFNIPDSRRRVMMGKGGTPVSDSPLGIGSTIGNVGGQELHVILSTEMAAHSHALGSATLKVGSGSPTSGSQGIYVPSFATTTTSSTGFVLGSTDTTTGTGNGHNTIQPSMIVTMIIKY